MSYKPHTINEQYKGLLIFPRIAGVPGEIQALGYEVRYKDGRPRFDGEVLQGKYPTPEEAYQAVLAAAHKRIDEELAKDEGS